MWILYSICLNITPPIIIISELENVKSLRMLTYERERKVGW